MLTGIIHFSLRFRSTVLALAILVLIYGGYTLTRAQYDIFPEFLPPQVTVQTEAPGLTPEQVEALVTIPVESVIHGVPEVESLRSQSIQGLSVIKLTFKGNSDIYRARQLVAERLATLAGKLPLNVQQPVMTPLTSSTSVVYSFGLTSDKVSQIDLRTQADWIIKPRLLAAPGVTRVSVFGGEVRQMQVQLLLERLRFFNLGIQEVVGVAQRASGVLGAGFIDTPNQRVLLQAEGQALTPERLANTVFIRGVDEAGEAIDLNIVLGEVTNITEGPRPLTSMASVMGKKGVLLLISSQYGANTLEVNRHIEEAIAELKPVMERQGITLSEPTFRPASFIEIALRNLASSLFFGAVMVVAVLFFFLRHPRSAIISATAIPISLVTAAAVLHHFGFSLNTMTLGGLAIAIGGVVDDAVIDVENIMRRLRENRLNGQPRSRFSVIKEATLEVRIPVVFASIAVILVFMPLMTMTGMSGRLFGPLGFAHSIAILMSLLTALTVTPALCMMFLKEADAPAQEPRVVQRLKTAYLKKLERIERAPKPLLFGVLALTVVSLFMIPSMHSESLPELREGHFILHMYAIPGTSLEESIRIGNEASKALLKLPYIRSVSQHAGRAEQADETLGTNVSEYDIALHPLSGAEMEKADHAIEEVLEGFPGVHFDVDTFITERVEETISGHIASVALNMYGPELDALDKTASEMMALLKTMPEATNVLLQSPPGTPQLSIRLREKDLNYWGFNTTTVMNVVRIAYEGVIVGQLYEENMTTDLAVVLEPRYRHNLAEVKDLPLRSPAGSYVKLEQLADVTQSAGRYAVLRDGGRRVQTITLDVKGRDDLRFINDLKKAIAEKIILPAGTYVSFSGTAVEQSQSRNDLLVHALLTGLGILVLLSIVMRGSNNLVLVMANMPFALVGGIWAVMMTGGVLSLGAMVGFVTLFGITLRNSVMLMAHYDYLVRHEGARWNMGTVMRGSSERLLPIVMTALVTALGLLPLALGSGEPGRELEGPMAVVILGGLVTSTLLNLLVLPCLALRYGSFGEADNEA